MAFRWRHLLVLVLGAPVAFLYESCSVTVFVVVDGVGFAVG